jgi:hypothetical protein
VLHDGAAEEIALAHKMLAYKHSPTDTEPCGGHAIRSIEPSTTSFEQGERIRRRARVDGDVDVPPKEQSPMNSQAQVLPIRNAV